MNDNDNDNPHPVRTTGDDEIPYDDEGTDLLDEAERDAAATPTTYTMTYLGEVVDKADFFTDDEARAWADSFCRDLMAKKMPGFLGPDDFEDLASCKRSFRVTRRPPPVPIPHPHRDDATPLRRMEAVFEDAYSVGPATILISTRNADVFKARERGCPPGRVAMCGIVTGSSGRQLHVTEPVWAKTGGELVDPIAKTAALRWLRTEEGVNAALQDLAERIDHAQRQRQGPTDG